MKTYCVVDKKVIPADRAARKGVTCSPECARALKSARRKAADLRACRHCGRPSTPEERVAFKQWRAANGQLRKRGRPAQPRVIVQGGGMPLGASAYDLD